jgi:hypothetical protein
VKVRAAAGPGSREEKRGVVAKQPEARPGMLAAAAAAAAAVAAPADPALAAVQEMAQAGDTTHTVPSRVARPFTVLTVAHDDFKC